MYATDAISLLSTVSTGSSLLKYNPKHNLEIKSNGVMIVDR